MNSFIVRVSCNFSPIIEIMTKQKDYLNELFMHSVYPFYLEFLLDGFLLIMKNSAAFRNFRNPELLEEKINQAKTQVDPSQTSIYKLFKSTPFPKKGILFTAEIMNVNSKMFYKIVKENFAQVHRDIKVSINENNQINVNFTTYESIELYGIISNLFTEELEYNIISC